MRYGRYYGDSRLPDIEAENKNKPKDRFPDRRFGKRPSEIPLGDFK